MIPKKRIHVIEKQNVNTARKGNLPFTIPACMAGVRISGAFKVDFFSNRFPNSESNICAQEPARSGTSFGLPDAIERTIREDGPFWFTQRSWVVLPENSSHLWLCGSSCLCASLVFQPNEFLVPQFYSNKNAASSQDQTDDREFGERKSDVKRVTPKSSSK